VEIVWLGHACFRLRGRDAALVSDPFGRALGYPPLKVSADVVTVSHREENHAAVDAVGGSPKVVEGPGEYEINGAMIQGVATGRDTERPLRGGRNTAYLIRLDEVVVCHLGDLRQRLTAEQVEVLKDPDVLLIPVGGHCTIGATEAAEVVSQLEPRLVIPMHYKTSAVELPLETAERFFREMAAAEVALQPKLVVTPSSVPEQTTVVALDYRR